MIDDRLALVPLLRATEDCGRVSLAGESIAVPFVGAVAACLATAEMIKNVNGGPIFHDWRLQLGALAGKSIFAHIASETDRPSRSFREAR